MSRGLAGLSMLALLCLPGVAWPQDHADGGHRHAAGSAPPDRREAVAFPEPMRSHTLANMRDHLAALAEIQDALSKADYDRAAEVAEARLGMSSLQAHGAHELSRHMPQAMQDAGVAMHRSASQFAIAAKDASVTGDLKAAIGSLARVNQTCVACHAGFRLR